MKTTFGLCHDDRKITTLVLSTLTVRPYSCVHSLSVFIIVCKFSGLSAIKIVSSAYINRKMFTSLMSMGSQLLCNNAISRSFTNNEKLKATSPYREQALDNNYKTTSSPG